MSVVSFRRTPKKFGRFGSVLNLKVLKFSSHDKKVEIARGLKDWKSWQVEVLFFH